MNPRQIMIRDVPLVSVWSCATCRSLSLAEGHVFLGIRRCSLCYVQRGLWLPEGREREKKKKGGEGERRDKDRNERIEPRSKNKQSLNPGQQWNSQLGSGLCFIPRRTFSGQPFSTPLAAFSQHPHLLRPVSILNPVEFRPLAFNPRGLQGCSGQSPVMGVGRLPPWWLSCVWGQTSNALL